MSIFCLIQNACYKSKMQRIITHTYYPAWFSTACTSKPFLFLFLFFNGNDKKKKSDVI